MILILGGGLAGLSTAYHLGDHPHLVLEAADEPGGLCNSREIDGFWFDYTGHLLHVRDPRMIELVDRLLPGTFREVERQARIRTRGVTLPFPFQANLHGLPGEVVADCVTGFVESLGCDVPDGAEASFHDWSMAVFGRGISESFMLPYNCKLFRRSADDMTADWVSWAVPKPDLRAVVRGALGIVNRGMGYNSKFRYPERGGIDVLPRALAQRVDSLRTGARVVSVDLEGRFVELADGERIAYDQLVVTIPLPNFLEMTRGTSRDLSARAARLDWSVVGCLNLGVDQAQIADGAHWLYFPDSDAPFYRVGFPSNFSSGVAPAGTSSMYVEFGLKRDEAFDRDELEKQTLDCLRREGLLRGDALVLVRDWAIIDPGYVIFDRERQAVMREVGPMLDEQSVHRIGRYGAWTYSYMERAMLDGFELAGKIRSGVTAPA